VQQALVLGPQGGVVLVDVEDVLDAGDPPPIAAAGRESTSITGASTSTASARTLATVGFSTRLSTIRPIARPANRGNANR